MSLGLVLTIIFLVLLYLGMITCPLWMCFIPLGAELIIDILIFLYIFLKA